MAVLLKIDFVSDISCPWCVIGLEGLKQAIDRLGGDVDVSLHFQPFELNPQMPAGGQDIDEHLQQKYGSTPEQSAQIRERIRAAGAALGFSFSLQKRSRIYNTFDAHRLLYWAALEGRQLQLKQALFKAYFTDGEDPSDHVVLARVADSVGLEPQRAAQILASTEYANEVQLEETFYQDQGIHAVPAVIINDQHLIQGGQPVEVFEQALRQIAGIA